MENQQIQIEDTVKVKNWGASYFCYQSMALKMHLKYYQDGNSYYYNRGEKGTICKVIAIYEGYVGIHAPNGIDYVIGVDGLEKTENSKIKTSTNPLNTILEI